MPELGGAAVDASKSTSTESFLASQATRLGQTYGQDAPAKAGVRNGVNDTRYGANKAGSAGGASFAEQEKGYLKNQLQSAFQSEASERVASLLGGLGTADVQLRFDDSFRLSEYSADVLAPVVDTPERMAFVQAGGRHVDATDRTILNVGVGQRHFSEEWMLGYNAFFDYDVTRSHSRLGLGAEAWADYLKLSSNAYLPLSSWKDSPDFDDYLERAARGFDLNAKYYLPQYPQLGMSAKYEQYFGDEVDLLGTKTLERNPYGGALGLEWQPVPMLKVGVEHREAKGGQSNTQVNMGLEWRLGASLSDMLDGGKVAQLRQLQGMRHDLVERNNNIVLEYKEKDRSITIEHAAIVGKSSEVVSLNPIVNLSKGRIVSWRWWSPDSVLQGSLSDASLEHPTLTLPALPVDALLDKEFLLYLDVTDERGRTYQSSPIPVVVGVNAQLLGKRLTVISAGHEADSVDSPNASVTVDDAGVVVEFVLTRYLKADPTSSVSVEAKEVVFTPLADFHVEQLPGDFQGAPSARSAMTETSRTWVNRLKITPKQPGVAVAPATLSFSAKGAVEQVSTNVNLLLSVAGGAASVQPTVSNLRMKGRLEVGQSLSATYTFNANGGDAVDSSTYMWGNQGSTAANVAGGQTVTTSGMVPDYTLTAADVGSVKEVSVQAKNGLAVVGNTVTVDVKGNASDTNGGTGGGSTDLEGGKDTDGDGQGDSVVSPVGYLSEVRYSSSATMALNGVNGIRPVAQRDVMTAFCQMDGEPAFTPCDTRYSIRWFVQDGAGALHLVSGATGGTFTPRAQDQGRAVLVEVTAK
ncbi:Invasin [Aeromonas jandaei]|nr:Invasin [Aeromonas jandaei]